MKIRTLEQLNDHLDHELAWRKKELAYVKGLLVRHADEAAEEPLVRSAVALLYAHWEGFIRSAGDGYVHFVSRQSLAYDQLSPPFVAVGLKGKFHEAESTSRALVYVRAARFLLDELSQPSKLPRENAVRTEANLSSKVLRDIVTLLGIDFSPYETKAVLIDQKLLRNRNRIAHGKFLQIGRSDYMRMHDEFLKLLELFRSQIYDAARCKTYLRNAG